MPDGPVSTPHGKWPDPETLAAYADGTLDLRERRAVEAHLAECHDCDELVMEVVRIQETSAAEPIKPTPVTPEATRERLELLRPVFSRKRIWTAAARWLWRRR